MSPPASVLDLDGLLAPLTAAAPPGAVDEKMYEFDAKFRDLVKPAAEDEKEEEKRQRLKAWNELVKDGAAFLKAEAKHLGVAARLTVALTEVYGFPGLAAGLTLLARLVGERWDVLYPPEPAKRRKVFADLDIPYVWYLQETVVLIPLVRGTRGGYGLQQLTGDTASGVSAEDARLARDEAKPAACRKTAAEVHACVDALNGLRRTFDAVLPSDRTLLHNLGQALDQCKNYVDRLVEEKCPPDAAESDMPVEDDSPRPPAPPGAALSWDSLLARLEEVAAAMEKIRPESPVPDVVRHAVSLGRLPFSALMRKLIPDEQVVAALFRRYDITPKDSAGAVAGKDSAGAVAGPA